MNIAFFDVQDWEMEILKKDFSGNKLRFFLHSLSPNNVDEVVDCAIISTSIYSKINKDLLDRLPNLKFITTRSMGVDHIDLSECNKRGIKVSNAPHYGDNSVAEHAFGLILSLSKNIHRSYIRTLNENHQIEGLRGFDLKGKTLGVIGVGRIGGKVVQIARGFEMKVIAHSHSQDKKLAKKLGFSYTSLNELLKKSDIVTLHVPYCKENHHLINPSTLKLMKPSAFLINTSRGPVVDTKALLSALKNNKLAGAGLDVIEGEDLMRDEHEQLHFLNKLDIQKLQQLALDHRIIRNEKVVFTPHIAFYTEEAIRRIIEVTIENIQSFIKKKPINLVK